MAVTPDTIIHLLKVPIEIDNLNQLTFATVKAQYDYFISLPKLTEEDLSYQRKDNYILYPAHIDTIIEYNYCMYQNTNYTNKWFYAFITRMEYENDGLTRIYIETDCFQSWQFDLTYKACFVEREHVNDDTVGANVIEENLQLGDFICNKKNSLFHTDIDTIATNKDLAIIVGVTQKLNPSISDLNHGNQINGIYQGLAYFGFKNNTDAIDSSNNILALDQFLTDYDNAQKGDAIYCLFMYPSQFVSNAFSQPDHHIGGGNITDSLYINHGSGTYNKEMTLTQATLDGYTPKNNKCLTWPFNYLLVSNNNGGNVVYHLEDFYTVSNSTKTIINPKFQIDNCLTPGGSIRLTPENYKGLSKNQVNGLNLGKFPVCNWTTDVYTNWLTQNGVNIGLNIVGSALGISSSLNEENNYGVGSGILGIANTLAEVYKHSQVPDQANGNINCGDVVTASGTNDFIFYNMSIKKERAKLIDDFFTMYGYKINEVKVPNITGRTYWNFVKTINCNIEGAIPQEDLQKIKGMFDKGITLWHDPTKFLDYTQNNSIVTP